MLSIPADSLRDFVLQLLLKAGVPEEEARIVGRSLVDANLRGHDSHGVMRLPYYLEAMAKQEVFAGAEFTVLRDGPSLVAADGHWGFGQVQAHRLTERVIAKAKQSGVAVGTLIRSSHIGRLGEYCERAADAGLVSMLMVNTHGHARRVAPPGGKAPRLGTNPIAFGVPNGEAPMVLDFGTSATAEGKVRLKRIAGEPCPDGWIQDSEGRPTNDPDQLYADPPGSILPLGGAQAYKGFGLAMMVEVFAGALSGGVCVRETPINQNGNCVFLMAIDPEASAGEGHFASEVACLTGFVRSCPTVDPSSEIQLPGDPERRVLAARLAAGVPFDEGNWDQLLRLAERLGVEAPAA